MEYTQKVETTEGTVVVKKLRVKEYALALRELKAIPEKLGELVGKEDLDNKKFIELAPAIIESALPEVCKIFAVASDKDAEFFEELFADDLIDVLVAIFEINDFNRIGNSIKKLTTRTAKK